MLTISKVETFYGNIQALRGVDVKVNSGEIVTLIGSNGAGKSTLLMTISGVNKASTGEIIFDDKNIENIYSGPFNIQKYEIGGHVNKWHTERSHISTSHRILAWITYLNDVEVGGETEFLYYNKKIKPEKGKTLIWPAEWTHAHTGSILKSGSKYIITGWFNFAE